MAQNNWKEEGLEARTSKLEKCGLLLALGEAAMMAVMIALTAFMLVGCKVNTPEKVKAWEYLPAQSLKEEVSFTFDEGSGSVFVAVQGVGVKEVTEGDTYSLVQYRYTISTVVGEDLVLVMNGDEELARFVLR